MSEPLLRIENLYVQYGRFLAVSDLSFELAAGQLLGMLGPNGAGKTTTIRAVSGLQPFSRGRIAVLGHDVATEATRVGRHLGFAPDTPSVYDALTVQQFLEFIADVYALPGGLARERIDHWLDALWLAEKRSAKVASLSRGMRQRLQLARTLMPDPHVVLLDEPASGLDPAGRVHLRQLLASLRDQGKAIIVSSHILADLSEYCTHIAIMERGKLLRFGTVAQVTGATAHDRCNYRVVLAQRLSDLSARLEQVDGISRVDGDGDVITLEYGSSRADGAMLLTRLIAAGLAVAEFRPLEPDLEQAYLRAGIGQVD
ncbi:MAG: ABC transporter ATP-binding protein [Phycisphaerae bacterium]